MNPLPNIKKRLFKFGLSDRQVEVYLFILVHGGQRIAELVSSLNLPRSTVYEILKQLKDIGLVEEAVNGSFKVYKAYPITTLEHGLDSKIQRYTELKSELASVDKALSKVLGLQSSNPTLVKYYDGRSGARQLLWNTLKAKETVYVYSAWGRGKYVGIKFYQNFVSESAARNIKEKVLINPTEHALNSIKQYSNTPVSRTKKENIHWLSKDDIDIKGETFIYDNCFAQVYLKDEVITGFEIINKQFVNSQKSIFKTLWRLSQPL